MAKYGRSASKRVKSAMHRKKKGTLKSGSGRKVTSRKQAIAIGLSEAREEGRQGAGSEGRAEDRPEDGAEDLPQDGGQEHQPDVRPEDVAEVRAQVLGRHEAEPREVLIVGTSFVRGCALDRASTVRLSSPTSRFAPALILALGLATATAASQSGTPSAIVTAPPAREAYLGRAIIWQPPPPLSPAELLDGPGGVFPYTRRRIHRASGHRVFVYQARRVARRQVGQIPVPDSRRP